MDELPRRALSIRQPWVELILRGHKIYECRSRPTKVRGFVQIYAGLSRSDPDRERAVNLTYGIDVDALPRGLLLGVVEIVDCYLVTPADSAQAGFQITEADNFFGWKLANPRRFSRPVKPERQPQPSFFFTY